MIFPIASESFSSNAFLIKDEISVLIDIGPDSARLGMIDEVLNTHFVFINTHCHFDHVGALFDIKNPTVWMHEADASALEKPDGAMILTDLFQVKPKGVKVERRLSDGDEIDLGKTKVEVIHTPGHTPGGICLYEPASKSLFSGDTVFKDGIGRTDLPGGNLSELRGSIERLVRLCDVRGVESLYPGHGEFGTGKDIEAVFRGYF